MRHCLVGLLCTSLLSAATAEDTAVDVYVSGDLMGDLEPCGCTSGQLGGLGRRVSYLREIAAKGGPALVLDNGDITAGFGPQEPLKWQVALAAFRLCRVAAVNVGERDLYLGGPLWNALGDAEGPAYLSANVVHPKAGELLRRSLIHRVRVGKREVRLGIVGVLSPDAAEGAMALDPQLTVTEPTAALRSLIPLLRQQAQAVIVLAQASRAEARRDALQVPGIDVVFHAGDAKEAGQAEQVNNAWVIAHGSRGQQIVRATLHFEPSRKRSNVAVSVRDLDESIPDAPDVAQLMAEYDDTMRRKQLVEQWPRRAPPEARYVGSYACGECHEIEYARWSWAPHAKAMDTLRRRKRAHDPECVQCHTVGFGLESGYAGAGGPGGRVNVGCESCHGPGSEHVTGPTADYGTETEKTCESCHTSEKSPRFDLEAALAKIGHDRWPAYVVTGCWGICLVGAAGWRWSRRHASAGRVTLPRTVSGMSFLALVLGDLLLVSGKIVLPGGWPRYPHGRIALHFWMLASSGLLLAGSIVPRKHTPRLRPCWPNAVRAPWLVVIALSGLLTELARTVAHHSAALADAESALPAWPLPAEMAGLVASLWIVHVMSCFAWIAILALCTRPTLPAEEEAL